MTGQAAVTGELRIQLGGACEVAISSSRPSQLTAAFHGLRSDQLLQRVPALFALCAQAQRRAATLAVAHAEGGVLAADHRFRIEAALEYLWRFAIDLPQWAGETPSLAAYAQLRRQLATAADGERGRLLGRYLAEQLLDVPVQQWLALPPDQLRRWLAGESPAAHWLQLADACGGACGGLPPLLPAHLTAQDVRQLGEAMVAPGFCAQPTWQGRCCETGALAYQQQHPGLQSLAAKGLSRPGLRLFARLLELAQLASTIDSYVSTAGAADPVGLGFDEGGLSLAPGVGIGWVHTARGLLIHRVQLCDGRVTDYRLLAPTEWNFHPRGVLCQSLNGWRQVRAEQRQAWATLQVISLDPCVAYKLEVYDA